MDHRDIVEIQQLMALYGHAADAPDQSLLPQVFTEDAVFDARPCGRDLYQGLPAIAAWFAQGKPPHPPSHHLTNAWVHEERGQVKVWSKWYLIARDAGTGRSGDYHDVVVRTPAGWRIQHRVATVRYPERG